MVNHAATALAIVLHTQNSAEEAVMRARYKLLWDIASSPSPRHDLLARARLDGLAMDGGYTVCIGVVEPDDNCGSAASTAHKAARHVRRRLRHPDSVAAHCGAEVLICLHREDVLLDSLIADLRFASVPQFSWGVADGVHGLAQLHAATGQARRAMVVSRTVRGGRRVARMNDFPVHCVLQPAVGDPVSAGIVRDTLEPLVAADRRRGSDLIGTLIVFLDENGNVSSAARRLHLNRHSLLHRLQRIEQLTNRSLASHETRMLLDVSIRARTLRAPV